MDARLNLFDNPVVMRTIKYLNTAGRVLAESTLPAATQELVKLRASQINGCGVCTDMHTKDALHAGESQLRLNLASLSIMETYPQGAIITVLNDISHLSEKSQ